MTRRQLLQEVTSHELTEWMAYTQLEPLPMERFDIWFAALQAMTANVNRDPKHKAYPIEDFMLFVERPEPTDEDVAMKAAMLLGAPL